MNNPVDEYAHVQINNSYERAKFEVSQSLRRRRRCLAEEVLAGADDDVA